MSDDMVIRATFPEARLTANLSPNRPVAVQLHGPEAAASARVPRQPEQVPVAAPQGCARFPGGWSGLASGVDSASTE
eukprot:5864929-Pyramimonas_sp.AAC.1